MKIRDDVEKVWNLMDKIAIGMLVTHDGDKIRARPMAAHVRREEEAVYFLTDVTRHKDEEIEGDPQVCVAFADTDGQSYVSLTGEAEISNDRQKIKDLWTPMARAWWHGPDDPKIRVIKVIPQDAEYWDSPGTLVTYVAMAAAAVTGNKPGVGENRKVAM